MRWRSDVGSLAVSANRWCCLGIRGLAAEVGAVFAGNRQARKLRQTRTPRPQDEVAFSVSIEAPDLCPRYAALAMTGIKLGLSPAWLKRRLELCGMRALNNVVDATNYLMLELGHPLHPSDFAKIAGGNIVVRP